MKKNDYRKTREVLTRVHEFLSNLCRDAQCDDHCSECIGASDLADDVYDLLHAPPRNCDVGTLHGQRRRFEKFCDSHKWLDDEGFAACSLDCPLQKTKIVPFTGCRCPMTAEMCVDKIIEVLSEDITISDGPHFHVDGTSTTIINPGMEVLDRLIQISRIIREYKKGGEG